MANPSIKRDALKRAPYANVMQTGETMAIPLLGEIERLITEHGSAVILKERIELANDKYAALESKASNLETENKTLRLNLEKAEVEIQNLKKLTEKTHGERLEEIKEKILSLLAAHDSYSHAIAQALGISSQAATFHLEELEEKQLIYRSLSMTGQEYPWELAQEGRRYLITHGLLA